MDLFDPRHARKVLTAFGRAYGALPENVGDLSNDQKHFWINRFPGLPRTGSHFGSVGPLRRDGQRETLGPSHAQGGWRYRRSRFGVPRRDLQRLDRPSRASLSPEAAQAVLKALLPETGTDIKGQMRSRQELLEASGYANRPRDFDDLIHILDPELRLITPTDPEVQVKVSTTTPSGRYYQLTHDYLVHSLRDWLTRKQKETRRGRAELRLAERSALWNAKPENRHLSSAREWANIRLLTGGGTGPSRNAG